MAFGHTIGVALAAMNKQPSGPAHGHVYDATLKLSRTQRYLP